MARLITLGTTPAKAKQTNRKKTGKKRRSSLSYQWKLLLHWSHKRVLVPRRTSPRRTEALAAASLKEPLVYTKAAVAPSGDGGGGNDDGIESKEDLPYHPTNKDDEWDKNPAACNIWPKRNKKPTSCKTLSVCEGQTLYNCSCLSSPLQQTKTKDKLTKVYQA